MHLKHALRTKLESAANDLVYSSESDRPFEWFFLEGGAEGWPYSVEHFASLMAVAPTEPSEERTLDAFFKRHIEATDPYDTETQRLRRQYETLRRLLQECLRGIRVFRIGRIEVSCYIVGNDGSGNLAGLRTVAVET